MKPNSVNNGKSTVKTITIPATQLFFRKNEIMSMTKQQLETLVARVESSTGELMGIVANHNIRQDTDVCWCWTDENGKATCGGIGALAEFINNGCKMIRWVGQRNHVRLAVNGVSVWTTANGG